MRRSICGSHEAVGDENGAVSPLYLPYFYIFFSVVFSEVKHSQIGDGTDGQIDQGDNNDVHVDHLTDLRHSGNTRER